MSRPSVKGRDIFSLLKRVADVGTEMHIRKGDGLRGAVGPANGLVQILPGGGDAQHPASGGYPLDYKKGYPISGLDEAGKSAAVFHAGTAEKDGQIVTNGGRVLGVTALGGTLDQAIANAYAAAKPISFRDMHFRTDIGHAF